MDRPRVQVTYSAPPLFLLSDNWLQIREALAAQFPLKDITWNPTLRPFTRNIPQLDVHFTSFDDVKDNRVSHLNGSTTFLQRPLLNLFIFACDVGTFYVSHHLAVTISAGYGQLSKYY